MIDPLARRFYNQLAERPQRAIYGRDAYCLGSTVGSVRARNEDVAAVLSVRYAAGWNHDFDVAIVCDGMGGMAEGREAALIAASIFMARCARASRYLPSRDKLMSAVQAAQVEVHNKLGGRGGTTLSAAYIDRSAAAWFAHVGDTRVFAVANKAAHQVSRSDTMGALLNRGEGSPDGGRLIQFVGMDDEVQPQIESIALPDTAGILITSDGAHSVPKDVWDTVCFHAKSGTDLVRKLLNVADALGGLDNATALYVPAYISEDPSPDDGPGMTIGLLSLAGEREIWIPNGADNEAKPGVQRPISQPQPEPQQVDPTPPPQKRKAQPKRKRSAKPKREADGASMLPLEDSGEMAKLDFSDEVEG